MHLTLDIASEIYPMTAGVEYTVALARNLVEEEMDVDEGSVNGDADAPKKVKREMWRSGDQGLAAEYEYVMFGKVGCLRPNQGDGADGQIYKFDDSAKGDNQT
jgi:DNA-directed RNA polymerase I, II, and III subunit RPABC3